LLGPHGVCRAGRLLPGPFLPIRMGFDTQDLLRQAGYTDDSRLVDTVRILTKEIATTASTFQDTGRETNQVNLSLAPYPDDATVELRAVGVTGGTVDADMDIRVFVQDAANNRVTETTIKTISQGDNFTQFQIDPVEVSERGIVKIEPEVRSDGTNTVQLFQMIIQIEVPL